MPKQIKEKIEDWEKEFDKIGFKNQAIIKGFQRIELKSFIARQLKQARKEILREVERMNLWSKGTVEGTRQDILFKLKQKLTQLKSYAQKTNKRENN